MWIVSGVGVKYKKDLKELARMERYSEIELTDPSFFDPRPFVGTLKELREKAISEDNMIDIAVTNHPKRSWYARILVYPSGKVVIE